MKPIYITVGNELPLMIIPDSQAHLDGHTILTYTYNLYKVADEVTKDDIDRKDSFLHIEKNLDPDYLGYITFEQPGHEFTYTPGGYHRLKGDEVEEVIELINYYRDTPRLWTIE